MITIVTNCGACQAYVGKCIRSLRAQTLRAWRCIVTVDPCGDATYERAIEAIDGDARFSVVRNERRLYAMENVVNALRGGGTPPGQPAGTPARRCGEEIVAILDGDDWLATNRALEIIARTYDESGCWMTYGSWVSNARPNHGRWPPYPEATRDFRRAEWLGTAVRTFQRWLWERIDDADLRDDDGAYFRVVEDQAYMLPMLEMATTRRARHIAEVLMVYNRANPQCVGNVMLAEMRRAVATIRRRPAYGPLFLSQTPPPTRLSAEETVWQT